MKYHMSHIAATDVCLFWCKYQTVFKCIIIVSPYKSSMKVNKQNIKRMKCKKNMKENINTDKTAKKSY